MSGDSRFKPGPSHPNWGGGFYTSSDGYKKVLVDTGRYVSEHILIMEWYLGRNLCRGECVHHCNGIVDDNRLANLELMLLSEHTSLHITGSKQSDERKMQSSLMRQGTNKKEKHQQWKSSVTKERILDCLSKHRFKKDAARELGVCSDTLRFRIKHYNI